MPDHKIIKDHKHLQIFGRLIHDPNLWHLNRYSVATAFSVGIFCAFVPIPFQMVLAAAIAIFVRSNLPISIVLVWLTNPVTMGPVFYFSYRVGAWILGKELQGFNFQLSFTWLSDSLKTIGPTFLFGCFVCGTILAILSNIAIRIIWRWSVSRNWQERRLKRRERLHLHLPKRLQRKKKNRRS